MTQQRKHGAKVREADLTTTQSEPAHEVEGPQVEASPLYGVAMLKIAMELKKPDAGELDDILSGVLARMKIPEDQFRRYLEQNGGLLRTIAQKKKF